MPAQLLLVNPSKPRKGKRLLSAPIIIEGVGNKKRGSKTAKAKRNPMARRIKRKRTKSGRFVKNPARKHRRRRARRNPPMDASAAKPRKKGKVRSMKAPTARAAPPGPFYGPVYDEKKAGKRLYTKAGKRRKKPGPKKGSKKSKKTAKTTKKAYKKAGRRASRKRAWNKGLSHQVKLQVRKINSQLKKGKKGKRGKRSRASGRRAVLRARRAALQVQRRYLSPRGGLSGEAKRMARAHGLMRVNPSLGAIGKDLLALLPSLGAAGAAALATTFIGKKITDHIATMPSLATSSFVQNGQAAVAVSAGLSVGAYAAARMIAPLNKYASFILAGGALVTLAKLLQMKLTATDATTIGGRIGIPALGEYVGMHGFVSAGGRQIAVNGFGEYVGMNGYVSAGGRQIAVNGMGEYVGMGDIFTKGTLGAAGDDQLPSGRASDWGTQGEEHVTDFLDDDMDGALSGSIFD